MYEFDKDDYRRIFSKYVNRFPDFYPELHCWCGETVFGINGHTWMFSEVTGINITSHYMVLEISGKYCIYLPVFGDAFYHVGKPGECLPN